METLTTTKYRLGDLVSARSVAVIGASQDPGRIGGRPIDFLLRANFPGAVYPVNPKYAEVQGLRCHPDLQSLPGPVDLAVVSVPAREVAQVVMDCARSGVKGAIVYASGFAEVGAEGRVLQEEIAAAARRAGLRVIGPNCQGLIAVHQRLNLSFSSALVDPGPPGDVGLVAQSGAVGGVLAALLRERGVGLSHWISTGNEADVGLAECIEFFASDPQTRVIAGYAENVHDGRQLLVAAAAARAAGKPVVLLRSGRSAQAARAAASHTGAIAPENRVATALLRQAGVVDVRDLQELVDSVYAFDRVRKTPGRRLAILSNSGGVGVIMSDTCADLSLEVPALSEPVQARLREFLPVFGATGNPVDTTAQIVGDHTLLSRCLAVLLGAAEIDVVVIGLAMINHMYPVDRIVQDLVRLSGESGKPVLVSWVAGWPEGEEKLQAAGLPVFTHATRCLKALATLLSFGDSVGSHTATAAAGSVEPAAAPIVSAPPEARAQEGHRRLAAVPRGTVDEYDAKALLRVYGLPTVEEHLVASVGEAVAVADRLGYPVAVKVCASAIPHKSEHGLVKLGLAGPGEVETACADLQRALRERFAGVPVRGLLVQRMAPPGGVEVALGVKRDRVFGPIVMFGLGGVFIEYFQDIVFGLAPLDHQQAVTMIRSLRAYPLLAGARGRPPVDEEALADSLVGLSALAFDLRDRVREVDVNPLFALPRGEGVLAVDALVVVGPPVDGAGRA